MAYEERDMSGSLFKNDRKKTENHPDYSGKALVNGQPVWVSGWIKKGRNGSFLSLAFRHRDAQESQPKRGGTVEDHRDDLDSDIPF